MKCESKKNNEINTRKVGASIHDFLAFKDIPMLFRCFETQQIVD